MAIMASAGLVQSQEPETLCPTWVQGSHVGTQGTSAGSWIGGALGLQRVLIWDARTAGRELTDCAMAPAPNVSCF